MNGRETAYVLISVVIGILVSFMFLITPWISVVLICAVISMIVLKKRPEIGLLAIIALVSSIVFEESLPPVSIGLGNLYVPDLILLLLLMLSLLNFLKKDNNIKFNVVEIFLILFILSIVISAVNAIKFNSVSINDGLGRFRILSYYLMYFTVIFLIRSNNQLKVFGRGIFILGIIVSMAMVLQAILGDSVKIMPGRVEAAYSSAGFDDATRILPPGQMLVHFLFVISGSVLAFSEELKNRKLFYLLLVVFGAGELLTYNRSFWVSAFVVFFGAFVLFRKSNKYGVILKVVVPILVAFLFFISISYFSPSQFLNGHLISIEKRFSSLFENNLFESDSLRYRTEENRAAIKVIKGNPVFGNGLGNKYRNVIDPLFEDRETYIHNGYLWILLNAGLVGAIPLIFFFMTFIWKIKKVAMKSPDSFVRSVKVGVGLATITALLINFVNPVTMMAKSIVVIAVAMGIVRVLDSTAFDPDAFQ